MDNDIKKCPRCGDVLIEHPMSDNLDGAIPWSYIWFCENCGYPTYDCPEGLKLK